MEDEEASSDFSEGESSEVEWFGEDDSEFDLYNSSEYSGYGDGFAAAGLDELEARASVVQIWDNPQTWRQLRLTGEERIMIEFMDRITDKPGWEDQIQDDKIWSHWLDEARLIACGLMGPMIDAMSSEKRQAILAFSQHRHDETNSTSGLPGQTQESTSNQEGVGDGVASSQDNKHSTKNEEEPQSKEGELEASEPDFLDITEKMEFCRKELFHRAELSRNNGYNAVLGFGSADIVKSDSAVSESLRAKLVKLLLDLENDPLRRIDWQPDQAIPVRNLVHPSLYPLRYGYTRMLADESIPLETALSYTGQGSKLSFPRDANEHMSTSSLDSQWLPAEVRFRGTSLADGVKFISYINNLEWPRYQRLYTALEELMTRAIPLWNKCLATSIGLIPRRVDCRAEDDLWRYPEEDAEVPTVFEDEEYRTHDLDILIEEFARDGLDAEQAIEEHQSCWRRSKRVFVNPKPSDFETFNSQVKEQPRIDLFRDYYDGLQVIVKIAQVHLTPEKPTYDGGGWQVEGLSNEHICATAIYYYDTENIIRSYLAFRGGAFLPHAVIKCNPSDYEGLEQAYKVDLSEDVEIQDYGCFSTPQGRLLAFPNVFQNAMPPFELEDKTKPGHRKMVVFWLVNPDKPIYSTERVPPQQRERFETYVRAFAAAKGMPPELAQMIATANTTSLPTQAEALQHRQRLIEERAEPEGEYAAVNRMYDFDVHDFNPNW